MHRIQVAEGSFKIHSSPPTSLMGKTVTQDRPDISPSLPTCAPLPPNPAMPVVVAALTLHAPCAFVYQLPPSVPDPCCLPCPAQAPHSLPSALALLLQGTWQPQPRSWVSSWSRFEVEGQADCKEKYNGRGRLQVPFPHKGAPPCWDRQQLKCSFSRSPGLKLELSCCLPCPGASTQNSR